MLLTLHPKQYNKDYIIFSERTKNNILSNGNFYRIFYSPPSFYLNGIFIRFSLKSVRLESYFNKIKCIFDPASNAKTIEFIRNLEKEILHISPTEGKRRICRIDEQLSQGFVKIFSDEEYKKQDYANINVLLKISGVWTDNATYGVTFRFFFIHL